MKIAVYSLIGVSCVLACCCRAELLVPTPDLECRALRGDVNALRDIVGYYYSGNPESFGGSFWAARLGEAGTDLDKLQVIDLLIGDNVDNCRLARQLLASVRDQKLHQREIEEQERRIVVWEKANAEAERARIAFLRQSLGTVRAKELKGTGKK